jgi:propionyl-CoA carboxylase alpha chain
MTGTRFGAPRAAFHLSLFPRQSSEKLFDKVLVANRGEIACRVMRTCKRLGIKTVAVYSEADSQATHVRMADEAICVGPAPSSQSYLRVDHIMEAVKSTKAQAVHPGYGFLSENEAFAKALEEHGAVFVGPPSSAIRAMGDKIESKKLAKAARVSTIPGYLGEVHNDEEVLKIAHEIGYPVMIKASAGGGGKGMRIAWNDEEAISGFHLSKAEAKSSFGDDRMLLEKFIDNPRHIEIQILADRHGNILYLNERECSIQRRNQKVIEEAPSPLLDAATRKAMGEQAVALARAVGYTSAGTVEFLSDQQKNFYFLEMNTRLQVEHPITEKITGVDIVEEMLRVAAGHKLRLKQTEVPLNGWAMESRVYAEDPYRNFLPSIGRLRTYKEPHADDGTIRVDAGVYEGGEVSVFYDPLISKLVTWGPTREHCIKSMAYALDTYRIQGVNHNVPFLRSVMENERFKTGRLSTKFIPEEYPEGFKGHPLRAEQINQLIASAATMHLCRARRETTISDQLNPHPFPSSDVHVVVNVDGHDYRVGIIQNPKTPAPTGPSPHPAIKSYEETEQCEVEIKNEHGQSSRVRVNYKWPVDSPIFSAVIGGKDVTLQMAQALPVGFQLIHCGTKFDVLVRTPRQAELSVLMPKATIQDFSSTIRSPMPGLVISLRVKKGDKVVTGQEVAVVEAMKMQNVLRAERDGEVEEVLIKTGANVGVDEVLVTFKEQQ